MSFTGRQIIGAIIGGFATVVTVFLAPTMIENLDASEIMVIQSPVSGDLKVYTDSGWQWQGGGKVTKYPRRNEFTFRDASCMKKDDAGQATGGLSVRFYDGGNAILCGSMSWVMPTDPNNVIAIHKDFRSAEAFEMQAIRRSMESAATFSGPTMTAFESAAGRRNELLQILNDQTLNGVYKTTSKTVRTKDITGQEKDAVITEIVRDDKGAPIRAQESYVKKYNVTMLPMTISGFKYEDRVEKQIQEQQQATNAVAVAAANAKRADQDALTAESQGRANATKAKWEQEVLNAKTVADAQAKILIADASVKEAEAFKKAEVLRGEGEAARKRLVMEADGQLDKKLEALITINKAYADAIQKAQPGAWTPTVTMGNGSASGGGNATGLMELLTAKTARDLGVDLRVKGAEQTKK